MNEYPKFLYKSVEDKTIVWAENTNKYLVLENTTAEILEKLSTGISVKEIAANLTKKIAVPLDKTIDFVLDFKKKGMFYQIKKRIYNY